jgi:hypothetical protein
MGISERKIGSETDTKANTFHNPQTFTISLFIRKDGGKYQIDE